jgi:hypothetical protein
MKIRLRRTSSFAWVLLGGLALTPAGPDAYAKHAAASLPGKPLAPIAIAYVVRADPDIPGSRQVEVTVRVPKRLRGLVMTPRAQRGTLLRHSARRTAVEAESDQSVASEVLTVLPDAEGASRLTIEVHGRDGDRHLGRVVVVPLAAPGSSAPKAVPLGLRKRAADGQALIALPALER